MQNWDSMPQANYEHNWYGNMFTAIKREPTTSPYSLEHQYMNVQKGTTAMDTNYGSPISPTSHPQTEGVDNHNFYGMTNNNHPLGFNPLTPPGYPNPIIPQINFNQESSFSETSNATTNTIQSSQMSHIPNHKLPQTDVTESLTPSHTPPMDITPPKSPKSLPATPEKDNEFSSNSNDSGEEMRFLESDNDDESISKPKFNSHGKVKKFKCKQCGYIAITKVDFWAHAREHIKPEKLLECHFCPFVTELKHHLEYHIRKHKNLKPFQCDQCSYSCVNKSMLNSHLKSHSKVYQYRCADCDYATKYCHSFKLHLRKYTHKPGMVLNEDGTPNPLIIIDVYGTRRGPKMKGRDNSANSKLIKQEPRNISQKMQSALKSSDLAATQPRIPPTLNSQSTNLVNNLLPSTLANMLQQSRNLPFFPYLNLNLQMLAAQQQAVLAQLSPNIGSEQSGGNNETTDDTTSKYDSDPEDGSDVGEQNNHLAMDLTQTSPIKSSFHNAADRNLKFTMESDKCGNGSPSRVDQITTTPVLSSSKISRRKGRAFRFDASEIEPEHEESYEHQSAKQAPDSLPDTAQSTHPSMNVEPSKEVEDDVASLSGKDSTNISNSTLPNAHTEDPNSRLTPRDTYECKSCGIYFRDAVLHTIHMGYHSCDDEFKCNMCGEKCGDRLTFFVHIARFPHS